MRPKQKILKAMTWAFFFAISFGTVFIMVHFYDPADHTKDTELWKSTNNEQENTNTISNTSHLLSGHLSEPIFSQENQSVESTLKNLNAISVTSFNATKLLAPFWPKQDSAIFADAMKINASKPKDSFNEFEFQRDEQSAREKLTQMYKPDTSTTATHNRLIAFPITFTADIYDFSTNSLECDLTSPYFKVAGTESNVVWSLSPQVSTIQKFNQNIEWIPCHRLVLAGGEERQEYRSRLISADLPAHKTLHDFDLENANQLLSRLQRSESLTPLQKLPLGNLTLDLPPENAEKLLGCPEHSSMSESRILNAVAVCVLQSSTRGSLTRIDSIPISYELPSDYRHLIHSPYSRYEQWNSRAKSEYIDSLEYEFKDSIEIEIKLDLACLFLLGCEGNIVAAIEFYHGAD